MHIMNQWDVLHTNTLMNKTPWSDLIYAVLQRDPPCVLSFRRLWNHQAAVETWLRHSAPTAMLKQHM